MAQIILTIPGGDTDTVTDGDISFTFTGDYNTHQLDSGDYCVIAPAGVKVATSPAFATVDGRLTNGAQLDAQAREDQPFDSSGNDYNISGAHNPATIIRPGSVLLKMTGIDPAPVEARNGLTDQWAALHVVSSVPAAHAVSPAVWTGSDRPWDTLDIAGVLADLPSYSATGDEVAWSTLKPIIGVRNFGLALDGGNAVSYQNFTPFGTGSGTSNYGSYMGIRFDKARIGVMSDTWSSTDKEEALLAMALMGYDAMMGAWSKGEGWPSNGGHFWWFGDLMLLAIKASGRVAEYATFANLCSNIRHQPFLHTAGTIADLAPHNDLAKPYVSRWRDVTSVASDTVLVVEHMNPGDQGDKTRFQGGIAVRESDGAERLISSNVMVGPSNAITGWTWTFSAPLTGTTTADRFHVKAPFTVTEGMPDWNIGGIGVPSTMNPLPSTAYRQENQWSMPHRFARALGMVGGVLDPWDQYTLHAETEVNGLPSPIEPGSAAFIAAHSAAILALPQIV